MAPHGDLILRLCTMPGIDRIVAWTILSEIGANVSAFPDAKHLASWAALCPGNKESAGKRKSGKTNKGDKYLRRALVQAALAAGGSKDTFVSPVLSQSSAGTVCEHTETSRRTPTLQRQPLQVRRAGFPGPHPPRLFHALPTPRGPKEKPLHPLR
jgi:hypothetical protein